MDKMAADIIEADKITADKMASRTNQRVDKIALGQNNVGHNSLSLDLTKIVMSSLHSPL